MILMRLLLISVFCLFFSVPVTAQSYTVTLHSVDGKENLLTELSKNKERFSDGTAAYRYIRSLIPAFQSNGYLAASIDSISITNDTYFADVYLGEPYKWAKVNMDKLPQIALAQNGFSKIQW